MESYEEDFELYETAMNNAYYLITKKRTLDDIYFELGEGIRDTFPLPFNPIEEDGRTVDVLDVVDAFKPHGADVLHDAEAARVD